MTALLIKFSFKHERMPLSNNMIASNGFLDSNKNEAELLDLGNSPFFGCFFQIFIISSSSFAY